MCLVPLRIADLPPTKGLRKTARSLGEIAGHILVESFLCLRHIDDHAALLEQGPLGAVSIMTLATRPANQTSLAPMVSRIRSSRRSLLNLPQDASPISTVPSARRGGGCPAPSADVAGPQRIEEAEVDRGARTGERQKGHCDMRLLNRKRERGAHLIPIERTMAGRAPPARIRPCQSAAVLPEEKPLFARLVALEAGAARGGDTGW